MTIQRTDSVSVSFICHLLDVYINFHLLDVFTKCNGQSQEMPQNLQFSTNWFIYAFKIQQNDQSTVVVNVTPVFNKSLMH